MSDDPPPEEWRVITDFPDYEVSSRGRVRRRFGYFTGSGHRTFRPPGKILSPCIVQSPGRGRYLQVVLRVDARSKGKRVHQLVCEAFHGPRPSPQHEAAHNDGNSLNNIAANLRWAARSSNNHDRIRHGTMIYGGRNGHVVLTEPEVRLIRKLSAEGFSAREIAERVWVAPSTVRGIVKRERWAWLT